METYQQEVAKSLQELEAIHKKIIEANQGKVEGSVAVTAEQKTEIKQTITRWETVTTQFVETAIQTEAASNTTVGVDKVKLPWSLSEAYLLRSFATIHIYIIIQRLANNLEIFVLVVIKPRLV